MAHKHNDVDIPCSIVNVEVKMKRSLSFLFLIIISLLIFVSCDEAGIKAWIQFGTPVFETETVADGYTVSIKIKNDKAKIYYTTNGKDPDKKSRLYNRPFTIKYGTTVKAVAFMGDFSSGIIVFDGISSMTASPVVSIDRVNNTATITCIDTDAVIYYKYNVSEAFQEYSSPVALKPNGKIYAVARNEKYRDSEVVVEMNVPLDAEKASAPVVEIISGTKTSYTIPYGISFVTISSEDDYDIYYTLDGSTPTNKSNRYEGRFLINGDKTLNVMVIPPTISGKNNSDLYSFEINNGKFNFDTTFTGYRININRPSWLDETTVWTASYSEYRVVYLNDDMPFFITGEGKIVTLDDLIKRTSLSGNIIVYGEYGEATKGGDTVYSYTLKAYSMFSPLSEKVLLEITKKSDGMSISQKYY